MLGRLLYVIPTHSMLLLFFEKKIVLDDFADDEYGPYGIFIGRYDIPKPDTPDSDLKTVIRPSRKPELRRILGQSLLGPLIDICWEFAKEANWDNPRVSEIWSSHATHWGLAFTDGRFICAQYYKSAIFSFTATEKLPTEIYTGYKFASPCAIVIGKDQSLFFANWNHIVRIDHDGSDIKVYAGRCDQCGYQDGPAESATFNGISGMVMTSDGTIYICDDGNLAIRSISKQKIVSTLSISKNVPTTLVLSTDENYLFVATRKRGGELRKIVKFNLSDQRVTQVYSVESCASVYSLALDPIGESLLIGRSDGFIHRLALSDSTSTPIPVGFGLGEIGGLLTIPSNDSLDLYCISKSFYRISLPWF